MTSACESRRLLHGAALLQRPCAALRPRPAFPIGFLFRTVALRRVEAVVLRYPDVQSRNGSAVPWAAHRVVRAPPLTLITWPVMKRAPVEARKCTVSATSSGWPCLPSVVREISWLWTSVGRPLPKNSVPGK